MDRRRRNTSYDLEKEHSNFNTVIDAVTENGNIVSFTLKKNITKEIIEKAASEKLDAKAINYIKSVVSSLKPHSIITIKKMGEEKKKIKEEKEKTRK